RGHALPPDRNGVDVCEPAYAAVDYHGLTLSRQFKCFLHRAQLHPPHLTPPKLKTLQKMGCVYFRVNSIGFISGSKLRPWWPFIGTKDTKSVNADIIWQHCLIRTGSFPGH